ncbi:uncharacterized protein TRIADDRAFT_27850 [Trichoplax adhaerens]|uniref:Disease resistance R13L4/SHOC-2-like LRR domain-containing protein n=1 Tax=Trichoplax adhaerens TaxID=10228 RepID=B3S1E5_TRIAD|nr:hypothetical protein TRIADDRAFT_27850 [Trichoplax adhaerens]EDV23314.1 hypothetical protein TRIADDRAFT_27850 [Trichoplax adhaerens]|eukprot:XP_002114224.1 hypothetical protein TRIADDRAFT_27850 [Trichoplax adhaerens]
MKRGRGSGIKSNFDRQAFKNKFNQGKDNSIATGVPNALLKQARKSGSLNLSNRSLAEVPDDVWRINLDASKSQQSSSMDNDQDRWWDQVELSKLDLSSNQLKAISDDVKLLNALVALDIRDNQLENIPESVRELQQLSKLALSRNALVGLPNATCDLINLKSLMLEHNKLTELPSEIGNLLHLEILDISNNQLSELPHSIQKLACLKFLNMSNNKLEVLPSEIAFMKGLKDLNISSNKIKELKVDFQLLNKLERLDIRCNHIEEVPVFSTDNTLKELYLGSNRIKNLLGSTLQKLSVVAIMDMSENKIEFVPDEVVNMKQLERFDLTNNDISGLPCNMGNMTQLKSLILNGNPLRTLRRDIVQRGTVAILKFLRSRIAGTIPDLASSVDTNTQGNTRINATHSSTGSNVDASEKTSEIPGDLWSVVAGSDQIRVVDFRKNVLTTVPEPLIEFSSRIEELYLSSNKLSQLPSSMANFTKLTYLDLGNNQLGNLPIEMESMTKLREIILSNNRFAAIPSVIYTLSSLEVLLATDNKIESIDVSGLKQLSELSVLDLQNNDIKEVPPELGTLKALKSLQLGGNLFRIPRAAILSKGTFAVMEYLRGRIPTS